MTIICCNKLYHYLKLLSCGYKAETSPALKMFHFVIDQFCYLSTYFDIFDICSSKTPIDCTKNLHLAVFTVLHVMQTRYSEENSVRLSVRHTRDPWQNGRKICPDFYTIRKNIYSSFLRRRMVGGGRPLLPGILCQPPPVGAKSPILNQ